MDHKIESRIQWIKDQIDMLPRGAQSRLARHIGLRPDQVSRIVSGERDIQLDEWPKIVEFFGTAPPTSDLLPIGKPQGVRIMGMLGDDYWMTAKATDDRVIGSPLIEFPIEVQSAYDVGAPSVDGSIAKGDIIFTVPFSNYRTKPLPGDLLVIRRVRDDLFSYSLQVVNRDSGQLTPYLVGGWIHPDDEPIALVIGRFSKMPK